MFKTLLKSVREYKLVSILTPILMVGEAVMEIVIPFLMTFIVKELEDNATFNDPINGKNIALFASLMVVCAIFAMVCGVLGAKLAAKASSGFAHNLREDMYNNLQTFSFANIDNYSTSSLITRITTDVTNVQNAYQMCLRMLVRAPILFISSIVMTLIIEPFMALIFGCAAVVLGIVVSVCMFKAIPYFRTMFKKYDRLNEVVQEDLTAIRVVKSYVREDREKGKMKVASQELYHYSVKAETFLTSLMPAVTLVMFMVNVLILTLGSNMAVGNITFASVAPSQLQTLIQYSVQILSGVMAVAMCLTFISMSKGSADRICEVLNERTTLPKATDPINAVADGSIIFKDVDFCYSQKADLMVLQDLSFSIKSGETVGIIGATGSGKTSLVSLIPRLYDAERGSVLVGGVDVKNYNLDALRNSVAMVLQKNVLFSGSIAENLRWGDENATDEDLRLACKQACADEFIEGLPGKYDYDLGQGGVNVSGGQKQRLCIARALLKKPKIIIFDDSTSAVDTKTDAEIRGALRKYAPEVTKIIIAQRIASVQDADKIIVLDNGRINGIGTHEELIQNNEIYKEVYDSQVGGNAEEEQGGEE